MRTMNESSERESLCASCGLRLEDHDRGDAIGRACASERLHGCTIFVGSEAYPDEYLRRWHRASETIQSLSLENVRLRGLLRGRLQHGHNDTCSAMLGAYECSCGQEDAQRFLEVDS